ncbi:hypothetical protein AAG570_000605, partial [Ranatra chinensis]
QTAVVRINSSLNPTSQAYNRVLGVLKHVFLPQGYPESVSKDYVNYQIWDTIQAFCSTISNTLTTQAILKGVGVGDNVVSPISAAITWILKDGTGMVARILFAWMSGSGLDAECKKWRLFADVINDVAMFIELCLLPHFPDNALYILCISTSIKAIVGVAGGATRAAITQHQAIKGNTGDVSAKDGSQETCVNLLASLVGVAILSTVGDSFLLWYLFCGMTLLHLYSNYKAVKSLNFLSFNSERLLTMIKLYMFNNMIASPADVNKIESVILGNGLTDKELCGYRIKLGYSLKGLLNGYLLTPQEFKLLANIYKSRMFMLITSIEQKVIYVVFERNYSTIDVVEAYFQAILMGISISCIHKKILVSIFIRLLKFAWKRLCNNLIH